MIYRFMFVYESLSGRLELRNGSLRVFDHGLASQDASINVSQCKRHLPLFERTLDVLKFLGSQTGGFFDFTPLLLESRVCHVQPPPWACSFNSVSRPSIEAWISSGTVMVDRMARATREMS